MNRSYDGITFLCAAAQPPVFLHILYKIAVDEWVFLCYNNNGRSVI